MTLSGSESPETKPSPDLRDYARLQDIFLSWSWRYYDHLGHLVLYNLGWVSSLLVFGWLGFKGFQLGTGLAWKLSVVLLAFHGAALVSVGWAYLVFKTFIDGGVLFRDWWVGIRAYGAKGLATALTAALVTAVVGNLFLIYLRMGQSGILWAFLPGGVAATFLFFWVGSLPYHWPVLFFQNPPLFKIFYRSFLLFVDNPLPLVALMVFCALFLVLFTLAFPAWVFLGVVFFFSLFCMALEKLFLKYRITYQDRPLAGLLERVERERHKGWRDIFRPWEGK